MLEFLGFGGSFGVVSPGENRGDILVLNAKTMNYHGRIVLTILNNTNLLRLVTGGAVA